MSRMHALCFAIVPVLLPCRAGAAVPESERIVPLFCTTDLPAALNFWKKAQIQLKISSRRNIPPRLASLLAGRRVEKPAALLEAVAEKRRLFFLSLPAGSMQKSPAGRAVSCLVLVSDGSRLHASFPSAPYVETEDAVYVFPSGPFSARLCLTGPKAPLRSLFNGKDLSGWHRFRKGKWFVEEGVLVGEQGENNAGGWLVTDDVFKDFVLTFNFKISRGANSGVCVRYPGQGPPPKTGVEIQLSEADPEYRTGSLLGVAAAKPGCYKKQAWNSAKIIVRGKEVISFLNGTEVARAEIGRIPVEGHVALQIHGGPRYAGTFVMFKDIVIKPLR